MKMPKDRPQIWIPIQEVHESRYKFKKAEAEEKSEYSSPYLSTSPRSHLGNPHNKVLSDAILGEM